MTLSAYHYIAPVSVTLLIWLIAFTADIHPSVRHPVRQRVAYLVVALLTTSWVWIVFKLIAEAYGY